MMQKKWFKIFIWIISTAFFFLFITIIISTFNPEPKEQQVMMYMSGMMKAMENSLMGLSMTIESDYSLQRFIYSFSNMTIPLILISIIAGVYVRFSRRKGNAK